MGAGVSRWFHCRKSCALSGVGWGRLPSTGMARGGVGGVAGSKL